MAREIKQICKLICTRNWGDNVRHTLENTFGYNPESWSYGQGAYNFLTDMTNPGYWTGSKLLKSGVNAAQSLPQTAQEGLNTLKTNMYNIADAKLKGNNFTSRLVLDTLNPDVNVWNAAKNGSYPWNRMWSELDAEIQGFKAKNRFPALTKNLSQEQKQLLVKHIGDKFDLDYSKAENYINRNALYGF